MKYPKHSYDYEVNIECLHEIESLIPMTLDERANLRSWAKSGHSVDSNPWNYCDASGVILNYLLAFRIHFGFPSHIWDVWDQEYFFLGDNELKEI